MKTEDHPLHPDLLLEAAALVVMSVEEEGPERLDDSVDWVFLLELQGPRGQRGVCLALFPNSAPI